MNRKSVSLKDIAGEVGVSVTTVSRVLRGSAVPVSAPLRAKILAIAQESGYVHRPQNRAVRTADMGEIALVTPGGDDPFYAALARGATDCAACYGLYLLHGGVAERETELCAEALARQGFRAVITARRSEKGLIAAYAVSNRKGTEPQKHETVLDIEEEKGGALAARHLLGLGHRFFAFLGSAESRADERRFRDGMIAELTAAGISEEEALILDAKVGASIAQECANGRDLMLSALAASRSPTAVICASAAIACGAIQELARHGIAVPGQCSVMGRGDAAVCQAVYPLLTVVESGAYAMGSHLIDIVRGLMTEGAPAKAPARFEPMLIERDSVCAPKDRQGERTAGSIAGMDAWDHPS